MSKNHENGSNSTKIDADWCGSIPGSKKKNYDPTLSKKLKKIVLIAGYSRNNPRRNIAGPTNIAP